MTIPANATPLIALDAVVVDTETTGLDPLKARLIEIAAVPLVAGRLDRKTAQQQRVRPDEPVPASATAIHGIDNEMLRDAPDFPAAWQRFGPLLQANIVIGHAIGFDMAMLRQECGRVGMPWTAPRCLDTRLLAQAARPDLAGYSIEQLAAWLGIEPLDRHSALGDAVTTGEIFLALVPHLRDRGIRTLAEAESASRQLTAVLDDQHRAGWADVVGPPSAASAPPSFRVDTQPFRHRVADAMSRPQAIAPDASVEEAIQRMASLRISSLFVAADASRLRPETTGIATERDVLRTIATQGAPALGRPVREIANAPVLSVSADAFVYRAIAHMRRLKVRHLGVIDEDGTICGAVSARDLLRQRAEEAIWLGQEIDEAADAPQLARGWTKLPLIAESLIADAMSGRDIAAVISRELCALTARAAHIAEQRMRDEGHGDAPCSYAVAVLGSAGRGESLMAMDQDNAIIFAEGEPGGANDRWFERLGTHVADILHEVGVPYCKGGVMAKNPQWRGSMATWRDRIGDWIRRSNPQDLLSVDIFFDLMGVHGDMTLAATLRREAFDVAAGEVGFAKLLVESGGAMEPALGLFGRFRTTQGRIDLKRSGLFGIVSAARALAIRHKILDRSTPGRLAAIRALGIGAAQDLEALIEAQGAFLDFILVQQIRDMAKGVPPGNTVEIKHLSVSDRTRLRNALEAVRYADDMTRTLLFKG